MNLKLRRKPNTRESFIKSCQVHPGLKIAVSTDNYYQLITYFDKNLMFELILSK